MNMQETLDYIRERNDLDPSYILESVDKILRDSRKNYEESAPEAIKVLDAYNAKMNEA